MYLLRFCAWVTGAIVVLWLICYVAFDYDPREPSVVQEAGWGGGGYTPLRSPIEDSEVEVRPASAVKTKERPKRSSRGVVITTKDGRVIDTGLTVEEILEQLDIEYEDLYEYLMD